MYHYGLFHIMLQYRRLIIYYDCRVMLLTCKELVAIFYLHDRVNHILVRTDFLLRNLNVSLYDDRIN